jgi:hypothetical protein
VGLFDQLRKPPRLPRGRFAELPEENFMAVAGESHYQETLSRIRAVCVPGAEGRPSFPVALIPEPNNPHDANAIAVVSAAGRVGYLPRDDAPRYRATMRALQEAGYDGAQCMALLTGGEPDKPMFGVVLRLAYPESCEEAVR